MKNLSQFIFEAAVKDSAIVKKIKALHTEHTKKMSDLKSEFETNSGKTESEKLVKTRLKIHISNMEKKSEHLDKAMKNLSRAAPSEAVLKKAISLSSAEDYQIGKTEGFLNDSKKVPENMAKALNKADTDSGRNHARAIINAYGRGDKKRISDAIEDFISKNSTHDLEMKKLASDFLSSDKSDGNKTSDTNKKTADTSADSIGGKYSSTAALDKEIKNMQADGWQLTTRGGKTFIHRKNEKYYFILVDKALQRIKGSPRT